MKDTIRRVAIIGTGHVGSHVAFSLAAQGEVDELYMIDIDKDKAIAQATDVNDAVAYLPHHVEAIPCEVEDIGHCDIVVISAGPLPTPEQDRLDTLGATVEVLQEFLPRLQRSGFNGFIVSISNPADVVAAYIQNYLNYPKHKIVSTGTTLDSARLQRLVSSLCGTHRHSLSCFAMGEHGGSAMVPWSQVSIGGVPLNHLQETLPHRFPQFDRAQVVEDMKYGGYLVLKGKGSTEFGIAASATEVIRAIYHNEHKVLPLSCLLEGEYNEHGVFASVPAILGNQGVEQILELPLTKDEMEAFHNSCERIRKYIALSRTL